MQTFIDLLFGNTLTRLVFFPALACLPLLFFPKGRDGAVKLYALAVSLLELAFTVAFLATNLNADGTYTAEHVTRLRETLPWIPSFGIRYDLVLDGISMPLAVLGVFLVPIVFLGSWKGIDKHWPAFAAAMLLLTTGVL
ncbi:MAG TPA: hypothetical protein DD490_15460, partial [Acidobacteria bacterium]|nr:hypothetical protein [Acidobacteriota bacterium]